MNEIWKQLPDYPRYQVSNLGRVRSFATSSTINRASETSHLLKQVYDKGCGYYRVRVHSALGNKFEFVHTLVLCSFVGDRPDGMQACHNDGDKLNNHLDNLRWDTVKNNHLDKVRHGTLYRGDRHHLTKFTEDDIRNIRARAVSGEIHRLIAADYGVTRPTISYIVKGYTWKHVSP